MTAQDASELVDKAADPVPGAGALQVLLAHWIHEDRLYWSQIRTMMLIQATAVAAAVALFPGWLWVAPWFGGLVGTVVIHSLASTIRANRDVNLFAIQILSRQLIGDDAGAEIERHQRSVGRAKTFDRYGPFAFAVHPIGGPGDKGTGHQRWFFILSYVLSITTALALWWTSDVESLKSLPRVPKIEINAILEEL